MTAPNDAACTLPGVQAYSGERPLTKGNAMPYSYRIDTTWRATTLVEVDEPITDFDYLRADWAEQVDTQGAELTDWTIRETR